MLLVLADSQNLSDKGSDFDAQRNQIVFYNGRKNKAVRDIFIAIISTEF